MLTVVNYHYIRANFQAAYASIFGITPVEFENQLLELKRTGVFVHPNEFLLNPDRIIKSKENYILITFDDGLKEQYELALPILKKLAIPALFFINSMNYLDKKVSLVHKIHFIRSVVDTASLHVSLKSFTNTSLSKEQVQSAKRFYRFDETESAEFKYFLNVVLDYETQEKFIDQLFLSHFDEEIVLQDLYMNTDQVRELINLGYIGSHTHSHLPLGRYDYDTIKRELIISKKYLEKGSDKTIDFVSYPYGTAETVTKLVATTAREVGYRFGFTTRALINEENADYLLLHRFDCNDCIGGKNYK